MSRSLRTLLAKGYVTWHPKNRRLWGITWAGCENLISPLRASASRDVTSRAVEVLIRAAVSRV